MKVRTNKYYITDKNVSFVLPKIRGSARVGVGKHAYKLLEIYAGFDIETTNINQVDADAYGWHAYAYHMQLTLYTDKEKYVYLFRYWENVLWFFDHIADVYSLGPYTHLLIWIANFSFEFQFMRRRLKWDQGEFDFFAKEERQPLKATYRGIEFRECLAISGGSLAQLAKDYCTTQKLITEGPNGEKISDLDYSIERSSETPLTDQEEQYCINDVVILAEFSEYVFREFIHPEHYIPMTKTSILLLSFKRRFKALCKIRDTKYHLPPQTSESEYQDYILRCFPEFDTYKIWMNYLFRGGFVHGDATFAGVEVFAKMKDITSHYPTRMNVDYFPRTPFKKWDQENGLLTRSMKAALKSKCCILHCIFDYIDAVTDHSIESKNKCVQALGAKWDNGRLLYADYLEVYLTELDFDIYTKFYKWEGVTILSFETAERGKQPPFVLDILNKLYIEKNDLKKRGLNNTTEYAIKKSGVNTCFGAEVKRIRTEQALYDYNEQVWYTKDTLPDFEKERRKQLLLPQMGIWVTAHARHELLTVIHKLITNKKHPTPVYYGDTDSIKHEPSHKAEDIIKHYNRRIAKRLRKRGLRNINFDDLGQFDNECKDKNGKGRTVKFKTLGAKRYIYEDEGKIIATVAGMPKSAISCIGENNEMIFDEFSLAGFSLTPEESSKLTTRYNDQPHDAYINGVLMHEESSVALFKIPFKITITDEYNEVIEGRKKKCKL